jgi:phosphatidylinositol glycan class K
MPDLIRSPHVISISSSNVGESSYSHHNDEILGIPVIDRFTNHLLTFLEGIDAYSEKTFGDFESSLSFVAVHSTVAIQWTAPWTKESVSGTKLTDFFGHVIRTHPSPVFGSLPADPKPITCDYKKEEPLFLNPRYTNVSYRISFLEDPATGKGWGPLLAQLLVVLFAYCVFCWWIRRNKKI